MTEKRIAIDGNGVADTVETPDSFAAAMYLRREELSQVIVVDSQGVAVEASVIELETLDRDYAHGVVICSDEGGVLLMDPAAPGVESHALSHTQAYFMDLVGRIIEISTGEQVTDRRDNFSFNTDILERYEAGQGNRLH